MRNLNSLKLNISSFSSKVGYSSNIYKDEENKNNALNNLNREIEY